MNLDNIESFNFPFKHWEINKCLDDLTLNEIINASLPGGNRSYDGTRAADNTGGGVDGKLRLFIDKNNSQYFPNLTKLINLLQSNSCLNKISSILKKDLSNSFVRLEIFASIGLIILGSIGLAILFKKILFIVIDSVLC